MHFFSNVKCSTQSLTCIQAGKYTATTMMYCYLPTGFIEVHILQSWSKYQWMFQYLVFRFPWRQTHNLGHLFNPHGVCFMCSDITGWGQRGTDYKPPTPDIIIWIWHKMTHGIACMTWNCIALHCLAWHCIALHCMTQHNMKSSQDKII